jgi:hypothetical protein
MLEDSCGIYARLGGDQMKTVARAGKFRKDCVATRVQPVFEHADFF